MGNNVVDGKPVRTIEYDMRDFMPRQGRPGSSRGILSADLPKDIVSGGGNAPAQKYGDRWEHLLDHKAWRIIHARPRTALFTATGTHGAPRPISCYQPEFHALVVYARSADDGDASATPDGQYDDRWEHASCRRNAAATWTGETWFFHSASPSLPQASAACLERRRPPAAPIVAPPRPN